MRGGKRPGAGRRAGTKNRPKSEREALSFDNESNDAGEEINQSKESNESTKREALTIEASTGLPATTRKIHLRTWRDVRLELATVYRKVDAGLMEAADGTKRAYILKTIGDIISMTEFEKRMEELKRSHAAILSQSSGRTAPALYRNAEETVQ
jgi:hypothetical protein